MKKSSRNKVIGVSIFLLIILVGVAFYYSTSQSSLTAGDYSYKETKIIDLEGASVFAETMRFGSTTSGQRLENPLSGRTDVKSVLCGDDDGDKRIETKFSKSNNGFQAEVIASSSQNTCSNFLNGYIEFTKDGKVTANCYVAGPNHEQGTVGNFQADTNVYCDINNKRKKFQRRGDNTETFTFEVEAGDKIDYKIFAVGQGETPNQGSGPGVSRLNVDFEVIEQPTPQPEEPEECIENRDCSHKCESNEIPSCINNNCVCETKPTTSEGETQPTISEKEFNYFYLIPIGIFILAIILVITILRRRK